MDPSLDHGRTSPPARPASLLATLVLALCGGWGCGTGGDADGSVAGSAGAARPTREAEGAVATGHERPDGGTELILVGLDGATWHVIDSLFAAGDLPNLSRLAEGGVRGVLRSEEPILSPPIWTTIATGRSRADHGIESFFVTREDGARIPVTTQMRTARTFWDVMAGAGISAGVVGWWPSWPAEELPGGFIVSDRAWPVRFSPSAVPYGTRRDARGEVRSWDFERRTYPDSLFDTFERFILTEEDVTTPEVTERIFGVRAAPEAEMWNAYWVYAKDHTFARSAIYYLTRLRPRVLTLYLEGTDVMAHYYWHYRKAERFDIDDDKRRVYGDAVDRYYRYCDAVIGSLMDAAGPGVAVVIVSDHGFSTLWELKDAWERGETIEHAGGKGGYPYHHHLDGVFLASGPGFVPGQRVEGATLYDVTPTLLHRMGLPVADDMPGRVLEDALDPAFRASHPVRRVPTWEREGGEVDRGPLLDTPVDEAIMEKLESLGYVD